MIDRSGCREKNLKICMIGLGSIGKRHLGNLVKVLEERGIIYQVDALRSSRKKEGEETNPVICRQYYRVGDMPDDYDIIFITNPTILHYVTLQKTLNKTKHMFIEKPLFDDDNYDMGLLNWEGNGIYYVACPLRHKEIMKYVKEEIIQREEIVSARIISTSYLPRWRKGQDYRKVYSAKRSMGGGVTRDLIHEWDYAVYLFGNPEKVFHFSGHVSDLEIDSDDISIYMAKYNSMFLEMHLDYVGQKTERTLQIFTNDRRIDIDLIQNTIYQYKNDKLVDKKEFGQEDFYYKEMEYFFDCIDGKQININTVENAYHTLKIALTQE